MVTYLGSLVQLFCWEGGTLQTNITGVSMWGELPVCGPYWVCPSSRWHVLPRSTLLRLQVSLQGYCPKWALNFVHFPGLSFSGSRVLHKGTDLAGSAFCALPRSEQLRRPGTWQAHSPQVGGASYHPPGPSRSVSWVYSGSAFPCVSSGELISGCDPPGGCQLSRIPGRLGQELEACSQFGRGCRLWG